MKFFLVLCCLSLSTFAQESLTPAEKEMVELGRRAADQKPLQMASKGLQDRMQSEVGDEPQGETKCHYELVGTLIPTDSIVLKKSMTLEDCKQSARGALNTSEGYDKALIQHSAHPEWIVLEKKK
jgi:hypothetical protein